MGVQTKLFHLQLYVAIFTPASLPRAKSFSKYEMARVQFS